MHTFLLEIGTEEIPASYIVPATKQLKTLFEKELEKNFLPYNKIRLFSTPRRLALCVDGLPEKQKTKVLEKVGPSEEISFEKDGNLAKPALGFIRSCSAKKEDIFIKTNGKRKNIAIKIALGGNSTALVLPEIVLGILPKIKFPKSMKWCDDSHYFARPIRWLVALLGKEVLPLEYAGVASGRISFGARFLGLDSRISINTSTSYESQLEEHFVVADRSTRIEKIRGEFSNLLQDEHVVEDERLLATVADITESPHVVVASFDKEFCKLPMRIITQTLNVHQKYFTVANSDGTISNKFVFVSNGKKEYDQKIKQGNQKVVRARLQDAKFYFEQDVSTPLAAFTKKLKNVLFHASLGTMFEKVQRTTALCSFIAKSLYLEKVQTENILLAAKLCKADLATTMLSEKEFTSLEGYIGKEYALHQGLDKKVALAIYEHYLPQGLGTPLPSDIVGAVVSLADKIDSICGIIGIGKKPTGSSDPLAIRRQANGVVILLDKFSIGIDTRKLVEFAFGLYPFKQRLKTAEFETIDFIKKRFFWFLKEHGFRYDILESIKDIKTSKLDEIKIRVSAISHFVNTPQAKPTLLGIKRVFNILGKTPPSVDIDTKLFEDIHEKKLYELYKLLRQKTKIFIAKNECKKYLEFLEVSAHIVDVFFDNVMVNDKNPRLKANRVKLLWLLKDELLQFADFSKIVIKTDKGEPNE